MPEEKKSSQTATTKDDTMNQDAPTIEKPPIINSPIGSIEADVNGTL